MEKVLGRWNFLHNRTDRYKATNKLIRNFSKHRFYSHNLEKKNRRFAKINLMLISFQLNYWLFYLQWNLLFRGFNQKPDSQCHLNKCIVGFEAKICINLKIRLDHLQAVLAEFSFSIFIHQFAMQSLDHFQIRACRHSDKKEM